jgi:hypothetical protein
MRIHLLISFFLFLSIQLQSQSIYGKVICASDKEPLVYVSIGVTGTSYGTISDENGTFSLDIKELPTNSIVRFSMIGFKSQSFSIEDLTNKENTIILENHIYQLSDIVVNPSSKKEKIGSTGHSPMAGVCGLAGKYVARGYEIGTRLGLGDSPVRLISLNIRIHQQSFDSSLFRLHIRNLIDSIPGAELLTKEILFPLTKESGWVEIDLRNFNLVFEGDIALTIEWIKVYGTDKKVQYKSDNATYFTPVIFFSKKNNRGCIYTKWGSEGKWSKDEGQSPAFYVTIQ